MKGLKFKLAENKREMTNIGYEVIVVVDRVLFRAREEKTEEGKITVYEYLIDLIGYDDKGKPTFFQNDEEELMEEIAYGNYELSYTLAP